MKSINLRKKISVSIVISLLLVMITSCIADSSWLDLVGHWQDSQTPEFEIEFKQNGSFSEYFMGNKISDGTFTANGNIINFHYNDKCGGENQVSCNVRLGFNVAGNTLVITDSQGDIYFKRVTNSMSISSTQKSQQTSDVSKPIIFCRDTDKYVGEYVTCKISRAYCSYQSNIDGNPTFCNDAPYPNHDFTYLIWGKDFSSHNGQCLIVSGYISMYNGKPQIETENDPNYSVCK